MDKRIVAGAVCGVLVFCMGRCSTGGESSPPRSEPRRVPAPGPTRTVSITKTETVTKIVTKVPQACLNAISGLENIGRSASNLADVGTPQLDLMRDAHQAMAGKDYSKLVDLQEKQMRLNDRTVKDMADLNLELLPQIRRYSKQCKQAKR